MISLSGDGKALSLFLSESVQHKDKQHIVIFTGIYRNIHAVTSVISDEHISQHKFGKLISQAI